MYSGAAFSLYDTGPCTNKNEVFDFGMPVLDFIISFVIMAGVFTASDSNGSIVFGTVAKFFLCFSVYTITHELLHLAS